MSFHSSFYFFFYFCSFVSDLLEMGTECEWDRMKKFAPPPLFESRPCRCHGITVT